MEKRSTLGTVRNRVARPPQPPPPPPVAQSKSGQMATSVAAKRSKSLPPLKPTVASVKGKNRVDPRSGDSGVSVRIKIKEIDEVNSDTDSGKSVDGTADNLSKTVGSVDFEYMEGYWNNSSCVRKVTNFILESQEYKVGKLNARALQKIENNKIFFSTPSPMAGESNFAVSVLFWAFWGSLTPQATLSCRRRTFLLKLKSRR